MPTYEYKCDKCGHLFEQMQGITSKSLRKCPKCGKLALKRLIGTGAGLIFKGSGFYATDYRSEKYKEAARKDVAPASAPATADKAASGGESKPAPTKAADKPAKAPANKS